jgi:hypothetical protein
MRMLDPRAPAWRMKYGTRRRVFYSEGCWWSVHFDNWDKLKRFSSLSLFESLYLVMHWSDSNENDSNDNKRKLVLQTVFVMHIFASLVPRTRMLTYSSLERARRTTGSDFLSMAQLMVFHVSSSM